MNVARICDLAIVLAGCRHEHEWTIQRAPDDGGRRYCMRCGAMQGVEGRWLQPLLVEDIARQLAGEPNTEPVSSNELPLPLVMRRNRP